MDSQKHFNQLNNLSEEITTLASMRSILFWDQQTQLPKKAVACRAKQAEALSKLVHDKQISKKYRTALGKLVDLETGTITAKDLKPEQKACVREWHKDYHILSKVPASLLSELTEHKAMTVNAWIHAKSEKSFLKIAPYLEKMLHLVLKQAEYVGYKDHPYDALLQMFEAPFCHLAPDYTKASIDKLFSSFKKKIMPIARTVYNQQKRIPKIALPGTPNKNAALVKLITDFMGLPSDRLVTSESAHPFCLSLGPSDHRFTVKFDQDPWEMGLLATLHEGGHAMYNLGLPEEHFGNPLGKPSSIAIHESQSRIWETAVGLSEEFSQWIFPHLKKLYPKQLEGFSYKSLYRYLNKAAISPKRVGSGELFYNQHIFLRYEIECALIEGKLAIKDLPEAWNAKSIEYLMVEPKDPSEGCLQDMHWYAGFIGYFPSYSLGNLLMAAIFEKFQSAHPNWGQELKKGDSSALKNFLGENIHRHGRRYPCDQLVKKVIKTKLSDQAFINYIKNKHSVK